MKKVIMLIAAVTISTLAFAGGADVFKNRYLYAFGTNELGEYIQAYGDFYYGNGYISVYGYSFSCYGMMGDLDVNASAKHGTLFVNTADLSCFGTPPAEVSVECVANGEYSRHGVANGKTTYFGEVFKDHYNYSYNRADCLIDADGMLFDNGFSDGELRYESRVDK